VDRRDAERASPSAAGEGAAGGSRRGKRMKPVEQRSLASETPVNGEAKER